MDMKIFCAITFVTIASLFHGASGEINCDKQCNSLVSRIGQNATMPNFDWKLQIKAICKDRILMSKPFCKNFPRSQIFKFIRLLKKRSTAEVCQQICSSIPILKVDESAPTLKELEERRRRNKMKSKLEEENGKCNWCKKRVESCATIVRLLNVPFSSFTDGLCNLLHSNLRSDLMCRSVANEIVGAPVSAADEICTATDFCNRKKKECPFQRINSQGNIFQTALEIVSIVTQSMNPIIKSSISDLRSSFLVVDESVKCSSYSQKKKIQTRANRHASSKYHCKPICKKIPELIKQKMGNKEIYRKQFKEICHAIVDRKMKKRCHALHKSTDADVILNTLFRKQICQNLECKLISLYPKYSCQFCKFGMQKPKMKKIIEVGLETLTTINGGIKVICTLFKDNKCNEFLAEQSYFFGAIKALTKWDTACSAMGFCSQKKISF